MPESSACAARPAPPFPLASLFFRLVSKKKDKKTAPHRRSAWQVAGDAPMHCTQSRCSNCQAATENVRNTTSPRARALASCKSDSTSLICADCPQFPPTQRAPLPVPLFTCPAVFALVRGSSIAVRPAVSELFLYFVGASPCVALFLVFSLLLPFFSLFFVPSCFPLARAALTQCGSRRARRSPPCTRSIQSPASDTETQSP